MLTLIPPPNKADIAARAARYAMTRAERWSLFFRYAPGLTALVAVYLLITIMRSVRADFAPEIWSQLGEPAAPSTFTFSEMYVAFGVLLVNGLAVCIADNRWAFYISLATCGAGFLCIVTALLGQGGALSAFPFMVLVGFGLYLPYVAIHTTVFERLLAMTRERDNRGYLMYLADAFGYLGYVFVMIARNFLGDPANHLQLFNWLCWVAAGISAVCLFAAATFFATSNVQPLPAIAGELDT